MRSLSETVTLEAGIIIVYKIINNPRLVAPISSFNVEFN